MLIRLFVYLWNRGINQSLLNVALKDGSFIVHINPFSNYLIFKFPH